MSYSFDGSNDSLIGTLASTYGVPITLAGWIKFVDHPLASDCIFNLGNSSSSINDSLRITTSSTDNTFAAIATASGGGTGSAAALKTGIDATWVPFVGVFTSTTQRDVYISDVTDDNAASLAVTAGLQFISLGTSLAASNDYAGLIAEAAIWNKALSAGEIASFLAATVPSSIAAANLIGYWPLSASNSTQSNLGVDAAGNLTVGGATFSADHPTVTTPGATVTPNKATLTV